MPKYIGESKIPVMEFCEYCWEVLNDDGTCPTEGCIHNELQDENGQWLCTNAKCVSSKPLEPVTDTKTDATTADGGTNE